MGKLLILVALAGALGTLARFGLSGAIQAIWGQSFPWGTLAVNALGCLLFGFLWTLIGGRLALSSQMQLVILTGFMGAFTTFSTFAFETVRLAQEAEWTWAVANLVGSNLIGLTCILLGFAAARLV